MKKVLSYVIVLMAETIALMLVFYFTRLYKYFQFSVAGSSTDRIDFVGCFIVATAISIILLILVKWLLYLFGEKRYLNSSIGKIDRMSGEEFEDYLRLRFKKRGYKVEMTPASGDYGADLVCSNKDGVLVVQAKRYEAHVGTAAVQEVVAARDFYEADRCMVVTNNYFTKNAIELADANDVELIDRDELLRL